MSEDKVNDAGPEVILEETAEDVVADVAAEKLPANTQWAKGGSNRARHMIDQFLEEKRLKKLVDDVFDDGDDA